LVLCDSDPTTTLLQMSATTESNAAVGYAAASAATSLKRARIVFQSSSPDDNDNDDDTPFLPLVDATARTAALERQGRLRVPRMPTMAISATSAVSLPGGVALNATKTSELKLLTTTTPLHSAGSVTAAKANQIVALQSGNDANGSEGGILMKAPSAISIPTPTWHAPWKLSTVLSSHLGWVRCLAMDPTNTMFASGAADSTIKVWDLPKASAGATDALKITLTGHIGAVRGLAFSERHPYLFSCGEDKSVKCWDLETNQVVRHYHGHLSGIYCLALHPTLDILVTAGRDAVARVWDMRTKTQVHVLSGHENTISSVLTASTHPQVTTASYDSTVKLWDLAAGKCFTTLTHHIKGVRALAAAPPALGERTFCSASADSIRKWQGKNGRFLHKLNGHHSVLNALAVQEEGVLVSGGDDGTLHFWDYATGHSFQQETSKVQSGSLQQAENGILALQFDLTGTRLFTGEADKSIKIYKQDESASELTHPIDMKAWRKECIARSKERF
jgi:pleiotropic regulator 1